MLPPAHASPSRGIGSILTGLVICAPCARQARQMLLPMRRMGLLRTRWKWTVRIWRGQSVTHRPQTPSYRPRIARRRPHIDLIFRLHVPHLAQESTLIVALLTHHQSQLRTIYARTVRACSARLASDRTRPSSHSQVRHNDRSIFRLLAVAVPSHRRRSSCVPSTLDPDPHEVSFCISLNLFAVHTHICAAIPRSRLLLPPLPAACLAPSIL